MFCRQQVAALAQNEDRFKQKKVNLAVIGSGDPVHFMEFREITGYGGLLFSDPSLKAFSVLGFTNSIKAILNIRAVFKAASALKQGYRQGPLQGSTLQLGGAIVIDTSGAVRFFFAGSKAGDHPEIDALLGAVERQPSFNGSNKPCAKIE